VEHSPLRTALRLGRVSNLPTVWTNVLAAGFVSGGGAPGELAALIPCLSLFYVGGMYLNDAFDRGIDARERPERPIPSGAVSARTVFASGFALLGAGLAGLVAIGALRGHALPAGLAGLALCALILLYDAWHKGNAAAPAIMGLCRAGVYAAVAAALVGSVSTPVAWGACALWAYVVGLTAIAAQETLDRVQSWWPLAPLLAPAGLALANGLGGPTGVVLLGAFLGWTFLALQHLRAGRIGAGVVRLIAGIAWIDALLIAAHAPEGLGSGLTAVAVGVLGVALTRAAQSRIPGT
jgi:hypothetical protein